MLNRTRKSTIVNAGIDQLNKLEDYCSYFGLSYPPFNDLPEVPKKVFQSDSFSKALLKVLSGIKYGKTIAFLSGEKGAGKTTFFKYCQAMLRPHYAVATITDPRLASYKILAIICNDLGVKYPASCRDEKKFVDNLKHYLLAAERRKERTFFIFDNAEHLTSETLLCLDPLLTLNQFGTKKLHVIFIGESGLQKKIAVQLSQQQKTEFAHDFAFSMENSSIHGKIKPLTKKETIGYVSHRLKMAGALSTIFTKAAVATIYRYSGGIPQKINLLCDKAMRFSYKRSKPLVDYGVVRTLKGFVKTDQNRAKPLEKMLAPFISFLGLLSDSVFKATHFNLQKLSPNELALETATHATSTGNAPTNVNKRKRADKYPRELVNDFMPATNRKEAKPTKNNKRSQKSSVVSDKGAHTNPPHSSRTRLATKPGILETAPPSKNNYSHSQKTKELYPTELLSDLVAKRHPDKTTAPASGYIDEHSNEAPEKSDHSQLASPYEHAVLAAAEQTSKQNIDNPQKTQKTRHQSPRDLLDSLIPDNNNETDSNDVSTKEDQHSNESRNKIHSEQAHPDLHQNPLKTSTELSTSGKNVAHQINNKTDFLFSEQLVGDLLIRTRHAKHKSKLNESKNRENPPNKPKEFQLPQPTPNETELQKDTGQPSTEKEHINLKTKKKWILSSIKLLNSLKAKKKTKHESILQKPIENKKNISKKLSSPHNTFIPKPAKQNTQKPSEKNQLKTANNKRKTTIVNSLDGLIAIPEVVLASQNYKNKVTILPFLMDETPVTNASYAKFIEETGYLPPEHWFNQRPAHAMMNHPVVNISLQDAQRYAQWSGKRLPFPDEWEAAARGQNNLRFPWGDEWDSTCCNNQSHGIKNTMHVDAFPSGRSKEGCLDMIGNVWEWTAIPDDESQLEADYAWVFGGSFRHPCNTQNNISRNAILQNNWYSYVGFRCAIDINIK